MKRKSIKIDWEELESAFESKREDLVYYLDLVTGHVVLEGEGEDARDDGDDLDGAVEPAGRRRSPSDHLYVDPPDSETEAAWMADFVGDEAQVDAAALAQLREALEGPEPVEDFREVLRNQPEERDRWFLFRTERLHELIDEWLEANGVISTEPAPWKS
jgi:hypothetical protein